MKKTNISALLLAALLLIQLLCAPVSAVTAEPAADAQADAQTASDNSAEDAAAEHRRADAERKRRAHGDENEIERVADVGEDTGRSGEIARRRREERPAQLRQTAL